MYIYALGHAFPKSRLTSYLSLFSLLNIILACLVIGEEPFDFMGEEVKHNFQGKMMEVFIKEDEFCESTESSFSSSSLVSSPSSSSLSSPSSEDLYNEASSSFSSNSPRTSCGPLYELSQLMDHLPIKRGLSKFYNGKSQSFASLAEAESCAEDLAKKGNCYNRRMKWSKSYGGNLNQQIKFGPKAIITKRSPRRSFSSCLAVDTF